MTVNHSKSLETAKKRSDQIFETLKKAHHDLSRENSKLDVIIEDIETEISRLRQLRDEVVDHANRNDTLLASLQKSIVGSK